MKDSGACFTSSLLIFNADSERRGHRKLRLCSKKNYEKQQGLKGFCT